MREKKILKKSNCVPVAVQCSVDLQEYLTGEETGASLLGTARCRDSLGPGTLQEQCCGLLLFSVGGYGLVKSWKKA